MKNGFAEVKYVEDAGVVVIMNAKNPLDDLDDSEVDARPDLGEVLDGYEAHDYLIWDAVAELVDNSFESYNMNEEKLRKAGRDVFDVSVTLNNKTKTLIVHDNAFGMNREELSRAVLVAKRNKWGKGVGKYGLGLKTAASWFGKKWTVTTKQLGSNVEYTATVDIPNLLKTGSNKVPIKAKPVKSKGAQKQSYTTITVTQGIRDYGPRAVSKAKKTLTIMYQRFLADDRMSINFKTSSKTEKLVYEEPVILVKEDDAGETLVYDFPIDFTHKASGLRITGRYGVYPPRRTQVPYAGLTGFWRDRVILTRERGYWPSVFGGGAGDLRRQRLFVHLNLDMDPNSLKKDFKWDLISQDQLDDFLLKYNKGHIKEVSDVAFSLSTKDDSEVSEAEKDALDIDLVDLLESDVIADAMTLVEGILDEPDDELDDEQVEILEDDVRPSVKIKINAGKPTLEIQESTKKHPAERFIDVKLYPTENVLKCFVNTQHPFYEKYVKVDETSYAAYQRFISAIALAEWSTRDREEPVSPRSFLKVVDQFLRGKVALE